MSTDKTPGLSPWRRFRPLLTGVLILLLFGLAAIWRLGTMDASLDQWVDPPKDGRPAFIATAYPRLGLPINPTLKQRFDYSYRNFKFAWEVRMRNPARCLVGAQPIRRWGVSELLHQCMWISGTRYLIAREVQGEVRFGTTNSLNGTQWAAAAEQALRDDGLLLIRVKPKVVQVIPKGKLDDYQKAGLVKDGR